MNAWALLSSYKVVAVSGLELQNCLMIRQRSLWTGSCRDIENISCESRRLKHGTANRGLMEYSSCVLKDFLRISVSV